MRKVNTLVLIVLVLGITACDNEVDLNGDFVETPVVFGLLNYNADTQFVRINKTFLKDRANALDMAKDADNLIYDSLTAYFVNKSTQQIDTLSTIIKPKEEGLFSDKKNVLYYSTVPLSIDKEYELVIETPSGLVVKATTRTIDTVKIDRPAEKTKFLLRDISFKNTNGNFMDYLFKFSHSAEVARFDVWLFFRYEEVTPQYRKQKEVKIPLGSIDNPELRTGSNLELKLDGKTFYKTIANAVPKNNIRREVALQGNIRIEIYAADKNFRFYRNLNGPIDGLSQVRPEYSNIENGIGLFASRTYSKGCTQLSGESRGELFSGSITAGRGFVNP